MENELNNSLLYKKIFDRSLKTNIKIPDKVYIYFKSFNNDNKYSFLQILVDIFNMIGVREIYVNFKVYNSSQLSFTVQRFAKLKFYNVLEENDIDTLFVVDEVLFKPVAKNYIQLFSNGVFLFSNNIEHINKKFNVEVDERFKNICTEMVCLFATHLFLFKEKFKINTYYTINDFVDYFYINLVNKRFKNKVIESLIESQTENEDVYQPQTTPGDE